MAETKKHTYQVLVEVTVEMPVTEDTETVANDLFLMDASDLKEGHNIGGGCVITYTDIDRVE